MGNNVTTMGVNVFRDCQELRVVTLSTRLTAIPDNAFRDTAILQLTIPDSVTTIGEYAFSSMRDHSTWEGSLRQVNIGTGVTTIGESAFSNNTHLRSITIPGNVKTIGRWAFLGNRDLVSVVLEEGIEAIGESAFRGCSGLLRVAIPDSVKTIGEAAFNDCSALQTVILGSGLERIGSNAFSATALARVTIPDNVTHIGSWAFATGWNSRMTSATIGSGVISIGNNAFDSNSLRTVEFKMENAILVSFSSQILGPNITALFVPAGTKDDYMSITQFSELDIIERNAPVVVCTNHSWSAWTTTVEPNEESEGMEVRTCTNANCDEFQERVLEIVECTTHTWGEWEEITPAEIGVAGERVRICDNCGESEAEEIPALVDGCGECGACDECEPPVETTEPTDTSPEPTDTTTEPTEATTEPTEAESTPANTTGGASDCAHRWNTWQVTLAPTVEADGVETRTCRNCGEPQNRPIERLSEPPATEVTTGTAADTEPPDETVEPDELDEITISLEKTHFELNEEITVSVSGITEEMRVSNPWVAIYEAGAAHTSWTQWFWLQAGDNTLTFRAPHMAGAYEFRVYTVGSGYDDDTLAAVAAFTAGDVDASDTTEVCCDRVIFDGNTYQLFDESMTWTAAAEFAEKIGGNLLTITSADEQAFVEALLEVQGTRNSYWLGGRRVSGRTFEWITGEEFTYTNWAARQPDNFTRSENVMMIYNAANYDGARFRWNDLQDDGECAGQEFFGIDNIGFIVKWSGIQLECNCGEVEIPAVCECGDCFECGFAAEADSCTECGLNPVYCPFCRWCADCDWEAYRQPHCRICEWGKDCLAFCGYDWCDNCMNCADDCECPPPNTGALAVFDANDYTRLVAFAEQGNNRQILGWDLRRPAEWEYVMWCDSPESKRIVEIDFVGLGLTGRLNLTNFTRLEGLYVRNNQLAGLDVTGCVSLETLHANWNQLVEISSFDGLVNLRWVDIRYNNLDLDDPEIMEMINRYTALVENNRRGQLYYMPQHDGKLTETMIEEIMANDELVRIMLECGRIVSIDPETITEAVRSLDLNVAVEITDPRNKGQGIPDNSIFIRPAHHGEFGLEVTFDITAEELAAAGLNRNRLRLFHIDDDGNVLEEGRIVSRNTDGSVTIAISRASYYVMSERAPTVCHGCGVLLDEHCECTPPYNPCECGDCEECGFIPAPCECGNCEECGFIVEVRFGFVTESEEISINDAIEILKWLVGLDNLIDGSEVAFNNARITGDDEPTINDAVEILKWLVGLDSELDEFYGKR
jgi:hypothetical protein